MENNDYKQLKICIPTSSGGHLAHMMLIKPVWENNPHFFVTFDKVDANSLLKNEKKYYCHYPTNGNYFNLLRNTFLALRILRKEKPDIIISSGAAISIPFFFFGKKFFKCKCFYIEVFDRINQPTKSGKFCYKYADKFYVQWDEMIKVYPKAEVLGRIF